MKHMSLCVAVWVVVNSACGAFAEDVAKSAWLTTAEASGYAETSTYDACVAYCDRLARASAWVRVEPFGRSASGHAMPLMIVSKDEEFRPRAVRSKGKVVVLLQNCIHAGECAGKEASLALVRDMVVTQEKAHLLEHIVLLVMPIFNVDGHRRMGADHRVNQLGPNTMGWRVTSNNLNLNRDYAKCDTVEMREWLGVWNTWRPDLFFDNHTTNGSDHQYDMLYAANIHQDTDPACATWLRDSLLPDILPKLVEDGRVVAPYFHLIDRADPSKGVEGPGRFPPRFSTGYAGLCNRPTVLLEAHALKPFETRVRSTYDFMLRSLEHVHAEPKRLLEANALADRRTVERRGGGGDGRIALRLERVEGSEPFVFKGYRSQTRHSDILGGDVLEYTKEPIDVTTTYSDAHRVAHSVAAPHAYLVPTEWREVIDRLAWHGVAMRRLAASTTVEVEVTRFGTPELSGTSYEGRQRATYSVDRTIESLEVPPGTIIVPMDQIRAKVAATLLEPEAHDSLAAWGFFNAMFEQKEYAERYIFEPIAREMLARDAALKAEFEKKLAEDSEFAADARARLQFLYRRSKYWDTSHQRYPVVRVMSEEAFERLVGNS
jgi:hypothetical protein